FLYCSVDLPDLHSFPTRRSSDLADEGLLRHVVGQHAVPRQVIGVAPGVALACPDQVFEGRTIPALGPADGLRVRIAHAPSSALRSEEHTSELQSLAYLVCRLLLE